MPAETEPPNAGREVVLADKRLRMWVILAGVVLVAAGFAALGVLQGQLRAIEQQTEENLQAAKQKMIRLTATVAWIGGLGFVGMGAWFWRLGRRIHRAGRFPPPGMKVIKDTPVRAGAKARTLAMVAQVAALLLAVVGTGAMWYLYQMAVTILQ